MLIWKYASWGMRTLVRARVWEFYWQTILTMEMALQGAMSLSTLMNSWPERPLRFARKSLASMGLARSRIWTKPSLAESENGGRLLRPAQSSWPLLMQEEVKSTRKHWFLDSALTSQITPWCVSQQFQRSSQRPLDSTCSYARPWAFQSSLSLQRAIYCHKKN